MKGLAITATLAFRNLSRNRRRSILTIAAIAFALAALLVFDALKEGLHQTMVDTATATDIGALQVHSHEFRANLIKLSRLPTPEQVSQALGDMGITTFARRLKTSGLLLAGPKSSAIVLHGVVSAEEARVTTVHQQLVAGRAPAAEREVMVGAGLAQAFGLKVGDQITLMVQDLFGSPVRRQFTVSGLYQTGVAAFDQGHLFMSLSSLQSLLDAADMVSEIAIALPMASLAAPAGELRQRLGVDYQVKTWQEIAPDVSQLIALNETTMAILVAIVFLIVALGIVNTMTTITFERFREFGTIAALGATPAGIMGLVTAEALALGLTASCVGSAIGITLCLYLASHGLDLTALTSANQYFSNNHILKAVLDWPQVLYTNAFTLLTAVLAGLYPAWSAARQDPAQALNHL